MNKVKELSKKDVIIYSNTYNATNIFKGTITSFPLWVAQYYVKEPSYNGNWNNWVGFQYTDKGVVSGIVGNVDKIAKLAQSEALFNVPIELIQPKVRLAWNMARSNWAGVKLVCEDIKILGA